MTADKLHDAIGLLPADLVAEADARRTRKPRVIPWKRYTAMAACLVLIVYGGLLLKWNFLLWAGTAKTTAAEAASQGAEYAIAGVTDAHDEGAGAAPASRTDNAGLKSGASGEVQPAQSDIAVAQDSFGAFALPEGISGIQYVETPENWNITACFTSEPQITLVSSRADLDAYFDKKPTPFLLENLVAYCESYDDAWFEENDLLLIAVSAVPVDADLTVSSVIRQDGVWEVRISDFQASGASDAGYTNWHILLEMEKGSIFSAGDVSLILE